MLVPLVFGVLLCPLLRHHFGISGVGENLFEEVDVRRMMNWMEVGLGRVSHDDDSTFTNKWHSLVHVEVVTKSHAHHQDGVQDRVHVVRADVGDTQRQDVGLTLHFNELLLVHMLGGDAVNGFNIAGLHAGHLVRGFN